MILHCTKVISNDYCFKTLSLSKTYQKASSQLGAEQSYQNSGRSQNEGTSHTKSLVAHACPNALRCYSSHTCEPNPNHYVLLPSSGSIYHHAYLPTKSHLASLPARSRWSSRPICLPTCPNHPLPTSPPTYPYTWCFLLAHHTSLPTLMSHKKTNQEQRAVWCYIIAYKTYVNGGYLSCQTWAWPTSSGVFRSRLHHLCAHFSDFPVAS